MKYYLGFIFLLFACNHRPAPVVEQTDNAMLRTLDEILYLLNEEGRGTEANLRLDSLTDLVHRASNAAVPAAWHRIKSVYLMKMENYDSSQYHIKEAQRYARQISDTNLQLLDAMSQEVTLLTTKNDYISALAVAGNVYNLAKRVDTTQLSVVCLRMAETLFRLGQMDASRRYMLEALTNAITPALADVIRRSAMGAEYGFPPDQIDSAIRFYEQPKNLKMPRKPFAQAALLYHIGNLYAVRGNVQKFETYLLQSLYLSRNTPFVTATIYRDLAYATSKTGRLDQSDRYLDTAEAMLRDSLLPQQELGRVFLQRADNMKLRGNHQAATVWQDSATIHASRYNDQQALLDADQADANLNRQVNERKIAALDASNKANLQISQQRKIILVVVIVGSLLLLGIILLLFRRRQLQNKVRQAHLELSLLRTQMEPHFLFNALSVLQHQIARARNEDASWYLSRLSRLLKITLLNARKNYVPLADEVSALDSYLSMQQMQSDTFDYQLDIYEGYQDDDLHIPPMLLQPFVENAIQHGVRYLQDRRGLITVTITRQQHTLHCIIEDNGRGPAAKAAGQSDEKPSQSTNITAQRLEILSRMSRTKATLSVVDKSTIGQSGVIVTLVIPFQ
ncbi:hypothetical protein EGT74_06475 [Chitinophaga lutea]|uniref:Signal transduction histidine kinase internal region domain-containing protein n=1 Tax=Chitinophaga lutea TaxID=2488634 RepID=A0A3N4PWS7_9BACT|nr:histidine kinase [Chitinophaga lutea]RPE13172.1 hypothetical protein EGT74_06475 [Chitinophaga lutea]